jgi:nucleoside-diphosphate-sugar epimerase
MGIRILLTGASGAVGFEAFKELLQRNQRYKVRILSLDSLVERRFFKPFRDKIEIIWGDIRDQKVVETAVNGTDVVLHVAGIIPPLADHKPELALDVNVFGTRNLVDAIRKQLKPPKLIFTSSISVYGDRLSNPDIYVSDPLNPSEGDEYAKTKIEAENIIKNSGIRWSIFRLCGILVERLKIQPLMFHMPLGTALEWCHPLDVGYALVEAIEHDSLLGNIYNLGGGEACRIKAKDFLKVMFPVWGLDSEILPEYAFATQNFHSGYYRDCSELNGILHFQRKTLEGYIDEVRKQISPIQRIIVMSIPNVLIRNYLLHMSAPLKAVKENNEVLIRRYYGSREKFNDLVQS